MGPLQILLPCRCTATSCQALFLRRTPLSWHCLKSSKFTLHVVHWVFVKSPLYAFLLPQQPVTQDILTATGNKCPGGRFAMACSMCSALAMGKQ